MENGIISCIIPMYNAEQYIEKCIQSVLNQSYNEFEIIVVNDGSSDNSLSIVKNVMKRDSRIRLITTKNRGVSSARNIGIKNIKGDYVLFLDADDQLPEDSFELLIKTMTEENADIVFGTDITINNNGKIAKRSYTGNKTIWDSDDAIKACLEEFSNTWDVHGKLFKKHAINGILFEEGRIAGEDSFYFFQCCVGKYRVVYLDSCVYKVFMSSNSATRSPISKKKIEDILYFFEQKYKIVGNLFPQFSNLALNAGINAQLVILNNLCKIKNKSLKKYEKDAIQYIKCNKKYFITEKSKNKRLFFIVTHHFYKIYKFIMYTKFLRIYK